MGKRKRSAIRKAEAAILAEADRLQKAGIDCSRRRMFVGGSRPKLVQNAREESKEKK